VSYTDWHHDELAGGDPHNRFFNRHYSWRGVFDQRKRGHSTGSFGFMGNHRNYEAFGEEAFAPPVIQNNIAGFGLEQFDFEKFRLQFGGRIENTRYDPRERRNRSFTGFSGAAGFQASLWNGGSFVANYTHSYRAPALEELYAFGPHAGNLTFEIGDPELRRERADGVDVSLRHHSSRVRGDINFFQYRIKDYVYLAPTGNIEDGLIEAEYQQADARYRGAEARLDVAVHANVWIHAAIDAVSAKLRNLSTPLPRIPPLRGRVGVEVRRNGFMVRPEVVLVDRKDDIFPTETETAGYGLVHVDASYIVTGKHAMHVFGVNAFNLGGRLYRNHLSFIKEFAPEIGRGVRFYYTVQFF
jgi:iron complex outermembrane receptor protein